MLQRTLPDAHNQRILVRVDWNVPLDDRGTVKDDTKIRASLPTLEALFARKPKELIILTHLGSPVVRPGESIERTIGGNRTLRLEPVVRHASQLLKLDEPDTKLYAIEKSPLPGYVLNDQVIVLENLRFSPGELANDRSFALKLAGLGDCVVHEAFPEIHRSVASLGQLLEALPAYAGLRLQEEVSRLEELIDKPAKPNIVVLGGAKVHDKLMMIDQLVKKVDLFLLGGVMANTFLQAQGVDMRQSVIENDRLSQAKELLNRAPQKFILPVDFEWERDRALDIGPQTGQLFERHLAKAQTIFWNGPMGWTASGRSRYYRGSETVARAIAASSAQSIVAGGDTLEVIDRLELTDQITFCSTGGGATLAFLAHEPLPGLPKFS